MHTGVYDVVSRIGVTQEQIYILSGFRSVYGYNSDPTRFVYIHIRNVVQDYKRLQRHLHALYYYLCVSVFMPALEHRPIEATDFACG